MGHNLIFRHCHQATSSEHCLCPSCGKMGNRVSQTVAATFGHYKGIGRTRQCYKCGFKWRTLELSAEQVTHMLEHQSDE